MAELASEYQSAVSLLHELRTPDGFLASTLNEDNYKRIWARDSMVCGLAALLLEDDLLIEGLRDSLLTLAEHQDPKGMIPSNVDPRTGEVSFGSLVGRVDANTWFVIGGLLYYLKTKDKKTWKKIKKKVFKTRDYLHFLELNNRDWIYTPLSGNWADEYPVHGYTLYDNILRIWGDRLYEDYVMEQLYRFDDKTKNNFWPTPQGLENAYHREGYKKALEEGVSNYAAFLLPGHYDLRFDAAGNGLAFLLWPLEEHQKDRTTQKLDSFTSEFGAPLVPAFWPVIDEDSFDWPLLKNNFSYSFKNHPGNFHNGGVWPVWMGLYALGLSANEMTEQVDQVIAAFESKIAATDDWDFQEYLNPLNLQLGGKSRMGYSASGVIFMQAAKGSEGASLREFLHFI